MRVGSSSVWNQKFVVIVLWFVGTSDGVLIGIVNLVGGACCAICWFCVGSHVDSTIVCELGIGRLLDEPFIIGVESALGVACLSYWDVSWVAWKWYRYLHCVHPRLMGFRCMARRLQRRFDYLPYRPQ